MSNGNKLSLLSEAAAFVEHTDDSSPPSRLKEALLKPSNSADANTRNSAGTLGQLGAHPPIRKEMLNVNHNTDSSPYTSRPRPGAPSAADGMDSDNAAAHRQTVETQTLLTTYGAALGAGVAASPRAYADPTQRCACEAAETRPIDSTAFISISSSLAPQLGAPNSLGDALLHAATANYLSTYFAHLAQAQAQAQVAHAAMQGGPLTVTSDNVILSSLPLIATPYSLAIGAQSPASTHAAQLNGGVALQRPAVLPIIGVQLPPRNSLPGDPCSCRSHADDSRMAELKLRLVDFDAESGISARTLDSERIESTRLRSSSEVVTESLSSRCVQPAAVALQQRSGETEPASGPARPEDDESPTSQSQLSRPYKKRKVVIRAFSDVTAERRARAQTPTQFSTATQQSDAAATSSTPDAPNDNGSHSRFMGDELNGTRSPLPGFYYAYGPSRRRLLVAAAASTPRSSCMSPLDHHNAAVRNRSQSPYSLSSALSGASSPCSSLSGSCTNLLEAVACSNSNGLSASLNSSMQQTIANCSSQTSATAGGSDTFNALKAFRGLSIGSRISTTSTTPVSIGAPSSSGYASELPSSSGCFASPTHAVPASAAKPNRSVVIMNVDADEQLEEHFTRSLLWPTNEAQLQLQKSNNSPLDAASKQRLPIVGKSDRLVDEHIRKSLVQRAASSASRSQKVTVKRTESCPQTLKRTAPVSPPPTRAACANIYYVNESGADTITSDDRRNQLSVDVAVNAQMWPHRVDHAQTNAQKSVDTVGDAGVVIKVERDESVDVDEHFRRALGSGWTNITKLHTGLPSTASATEDTLSCDAIEVTHL